MISLNCLFEQEEDSKGQYKVPMIEKLKTHKLNPRTNRMKNFKTIKYLFTDIAPEERTFKNLPRYANKDPKVRFQDWLEIDAKKRHPDHSVTSWGWAADGKCYGWSHRAVHGFKVGEIVKADTIGNDSKKEYEIKTKEQAEEAAKKFAKDVS
jgi:hypothetical protein